VLPMHIPAVWDLKIPLGPDWMIGIEFILINYNLGTY
jgi:hypothetical protein